MPEQLPSARERLGRLGRQLVDVRESPGASRVALRVGLSLLVPLLVLLAAGRIHWGVYALFGTFAGVFAGRAPWPGRWRRQAAMVGVMTGAVALGSLVGTSPHRVALAVPVCAAWAGLTSAASDRFRWVPPGPLIPVFALSTCTAIPVSIGGAAVAAGCAAAAGGWAVLLGQVEWWWFRAPASSEPPPHPTAGLPRRRKIVGAARAAASVLVAGTIAGALGIGHPYWAMVAAVAPLSIPGLTAQVVRGAHRLLGTVVGLALAAGLLSLHLPAWQVVLVAAVLQGCTELVITRHYGLALVLITPAALLMGQLGNPQPAGELLADRLVETAIGVVVGLAAAVLTWDRPRRQRSRGSGPASPIRQ